MADPRRIAAIAALATAIAVPAEGLRQRAYKCPASIWTACYGHTGPDVKPGVKYSMAQCNQWLNADMKQAIATVERCHPGLPERVTAAFADAVFNIGPRIACGPDSTAARMLKAGDIEGACRELPKWSKARVAGVLVELPGLTKRRAREQHLCLTGELV